MFVLKDVNKMVVFFDPPEKNKPPNKMSNVIKIGKIIDFKKFEFVCCGILKSSTQLEPF